ncbi:MAG: glycosyltransferase family 39 protein [Chloroflexi bacterium]|nr:glycosyltransferase family 39 protein [Chloroflexota bacterium]
MGRRSRWHAVAACSIVAVAAAAVRLVWLTTEPMGLHGDEAAYGLEAERILRSGWIGPYSGIALGLPSGPLYLVAGAVALLGNTILAVRIVQALCGVLTVVALFVVVARSFGVLAATAAAAILATLAWHVQLSRVGFSLASWTLCVVVLLGLLAEAIRARDWRWWAAAGVAGSAGIYVYNGDVGVLALVALYLVVRLAREYRWRRGRESPSGTSTLVGTGVFAAALVLSAGPMLGYALDPSNAFLNHFQAATVASSARWAGVTGPTRALLLASDYGAAWAELCCRPRVDGVDGTGLTPAAPLVLLVLAAVGVCFGLRRGGCDARDALVELSLLLVVGLPVAAVLTDLDATMRRTVALAPILALFAGVGVAGLVELVSVHGARARLAARLALAIVVGGLAFQGVTDYFTHFVGSSADRGVFATEITHAALYLRTLPPGTHVYFFSTRWSVNYETMHFLAPTIVGEDRSQEFGAAHLGLPDEPLPRPSVLIFMGPYGALLADARSRYPGGQTIDASPDYLAYVLAS